MNEPHHPYIQPTNTTRTTVCFVDHFLFFESESEAGKLGTKDNKLVLNFGLFPKRFDKIDSYYKNKPGSPKFFNKVPDKYKEANGKGRWNCRFFDRKYNPVLTCAILGDERLIKIDAIGSSKQEILDKIELVDSMLDSFYVYDAKKAKERAAKVAEEKAAKEAENQEMSDVSTETSNEASVEE